MRVSRKSLALIADKKAKVILASLFLSVVTVGLLSGHSTSAAGLLQTAKPETAPAGSQKDMALGLNHFEAHCASCHAISGKADNEKGKAVGAADLTSQEVQSKSDAELMKIVQNG